MTMRVLASFSGRVDMGFATLLFDVYAPAACFEEDAQVVQGWFCPGCLLPDKLRVEQAGSNCFGVRVSQRLCADREGAFDQATCLAQTALFLLEESQTIQRFCYPRMVLTELLSDRERTRIERFGLSIPALFSMQVCQTCE